LALNKATVGLQSNPLRHGDRVNLTLEWELLRPVDRNYAASIQLLSLIEGQWLPSHASQPDARLLDGNLGTSQWQVNKKISQKYTLTLNQQAPSGTYRLAVVVYDPEEPTQQRQPVVPGEKTGAMGEEILVLQEVQVGQ